MKSSVAVLFAYFYATSLITACALTDTRSAENVLSSWMGSLREIQGFNDLTLLDLSLPGTHDTLSYDLGLEMSDGGIDDEAALAQFLRKYGTLLMELTDISEFIRDNAKAQRLNVTEQLNNGARFLDLRMMYQYSDANPRWTSLHMLSTNQLMRTYLEQVYDWLVQHPTEVIVMWLSKHGNTCSTGEAQYPSVPAIIKQEFWKQIETLFGDIIVDFSLMRINETRFGDMVKNNKRAVFYVSDYAEVTMNSSKALDACSINNEDGPKEDAEIVAFAKDQADFAMAQVTIDNAKVSQGFYLKQLAAGVPSDQYYGELMQKYLPSMDKSAIAKCAQSFNIPGMNSTWCPPSLYEVSKLQNYYGQTALDMVVGNMNDGWRYPNGIYLDALYEHGVIETGDTNRTAGFAYVDSIIVFNVYLACKGNETAPACVQASALYNGRRAKNPVKYWSNPEYGRQLTWPRS